MEAQIIMVLALAAATVYFLRKSRRASQLSYIRHYRFHPMLARKIKEKYPHLSDKDVKMVLEALKDYFYVCNIAGSRMVAMPSQVVDVAWHEFILYTRSYKTFCRKGIGRYLHHTPTETMKTPTIAPEGIERAWRLTCEREEIDPDKPSRLPRLFGIDTWLQIEDGYQYLLDCLDTSSPLYGSGYCAGHIGSAFRSGDGGSKAASAYTGAAEGDGYNAT